MPTNPIIKNEGYENKEREGSNQKSKTGYSDVGSNVVVAQTAQRHEYRSCTLDNETQHIARGKADGQVARWN
jgi:hypothetical protein